MANLAKCVGIDLGTSSVKLVEAVRDGNGVRVTAAASVETNIEPSAGPDERRDALVKAMRELLRQTRVSSKNAIIGIPGHKAFIRRFRMPNTTQERLEKLINYEARQQIPYPLDQADLQWKSYAIPGEKDLEILLSAVRHEDVAEFAALASKCGIKPLEIGVSSFALFNAQAVLDMPAARLARKIASLGKAPKGGKKGPMEASMVADPDEMEEVKLNLNIGATSFDLVISHRSGDSFLKFPRTVTRGGNGHEITRSIMRGCEVGSFQDAERIKRYQTKVMSGAFSPEGEDDLNPDSCVAATQAIDGLLIEVRKSLDYFISQQDGMSVDTVVVSGGQALLPGMAEYVEEKLAIPTIVVDSVPEGSGVKWGVTEPLTAYLPALGLALQGLGLARATMDFLPEENKILRDFPYATAGAIAALVILGIGIGTQVGSGQVSAYRSAAQSASSQAQMLRTDSTRTQDIRRTHTEVADDFAAMAKVMPDRTYWIEQLKRVQEYKPPEVTLRRVELGPTGYSSIWGYSETERSAADFASALRGYFDTLENKPEPKDMPVLDDQGQNRANIDGRQVYTFRINFTLADKQNTLKVTPTPVPTQDGRMGAPGFRPNQPLRRN
jgi:type IV pilus assembly protein PilM